MVARPGNLAAPQWREVETSPSVGGPGGYEQSAWTYHNTHGGPVGYIPGWRWVPPPGIGDGPQQVYTTLASTIFAADGPGDRPAGERRIFDAPVIVNYAITRFGFPISGGAFATTNLSDAKPVNNPLNEIYPRGIGALGRFM